MPRQPQRGGRSIGAMAVTVVVVGLAGAVALLAGPATPGAADGNEAPDAPPAARSISLGVEHGCALTAGAVKCWGRGADGRLGQGDDERIGGVGGQMGADLPPVALGTGRTATAVTAGGAFSCALLDDGRVKCWGDAGAGVLGNASTTADRGDDPGEMGDSLPAVDLGSGRTATAVSAGFAHVCAILDDGSVKCWGSGADGRLGLGTTANRGDNAGEMGDSLPAVALGTGRTATAIAAGETWTCAVLDDGSVKCWGRATNGTLGYGDLTFRGDGPGEMGDALPAVDLGPGRTARAISAGTAHTCAVLDDGSVRCWGAVGNGRLGFGAGNCVGAGCGDNPGETGAGLPTVDLGTGRTATSVSAGGSHTCAVLDDSSLKCFGGNGNGQLGLGDAAARGDDAGEMGDALPVVDLGAGRTAVAVTTGGGTSTTVLGSTTCAVLDDAAVRCFGRGLHGALGNGFLDDRGDQPGETGDALPLTLLTGDGVAGHLTDRVSAAHLDGVMVAALDLADYSIAGAGATNGNGDYSIGLASGQYLLYAIDPSVAHGSGFVGTPIVATVGSGITVHDGTMVATRGAISGTVTQAPSGAPLAGALVLALNSSGAAERAVTTDAAGAFTVTDLPVGNHFLAYVDPSGGHEIRFHPAASSLAAATPVTVTPALTTAVGASVPSQPTAGGGAAITGHVTDAHGASLRTVSVFALRADTFAFVRAASTDNVGRYTLFVPPGVGYKLLFVDRTGDHTPEWHDDRQTTELALSATVDASAAVNATLRLATGSVEGDLHVADGWAIAIGADGVAGGMIANDDSLAPGQYDLDGLAPGSYRAAFVDPYRNLIEYWHDSPDFAGATLFAVAADDVTVIDEEIGP